MEPRTKKQPQGNYVFALDIGTRTVVGILGELVDEKYYIRDCVVEPHTRRAMVDGQVEDIKQVAKIVSKVKGKLEERNNIALTRAAIAAAGRALKTVNAVSEYDIEEKEIITGEMVASMEMETIQKAQAQLDDETRKSGTLFYCVGHNVIRYTLDGFKIISLEGHKGKKAKVEMVVAFLPSIVVEGLYSVMDLTRLEVSSLTLEPIAAMNVIIPPEIRLINIALVDIGAGTSDIAIAKDGAIISYAMATTAGDEITEEIIRTFLVDFNTAEQMKHDVGEQYEVSYTDIFGFSHTIDRDELLDRISPSVESLAKTICDCIVKINGGAPSAVFLVGGGSLTEGLPEQVAEQLGIDENHVAVGGYQFLKNVDMGDMQLGAEFITPIGIGVTAVTNRGYDFSVITINGDKIRIFDTKQLSVFELLTMAGYKANEIMGHSGRNLTYTLNGNRVVVKGTGYMPAEIKVNGKPASLTTKVTQGDNVTLKAGENGRDAIVTLREAVDYRKYNSGYVYIGGHSIAFGLKIYVNGKEEQPDYEIQMSDEIRTGGIITLGDLLETLGGDLEADIFVNGDSKDESYPLRDNDRIHISAKKSEPLVQQPERKVKVEKRPATPRREASPDESSEEYDNEDYQNTEEYSDYGEYDEEYEDKAAGYENNSEPEYRSVPVARERAREPKATPRAATEGVKAPQRQFASSYDPTAGETAYASSQAAQTAVARQGNSSYDPAAGDTTYVSSRAEKAPIRQGNSSYDPMSGAAAYISKKPNKPASSDLHSLFSSNDNVPYLDDSEMKADMEESVNSPTPASPKANGGENAGAPIMVNLNGKALYLPQTDDRCSHKFLELLNYIKIDTTTPKSDVSLTLNGGFANFNDELKNGDVAVIRWKEL